MASQSMLELDHLHVGFQNSQSVKSEQIQMVWGQTENVLRKKYI